MKKKVGFWDLLVCALSRFEMFLYLERDGFERELGRRTL